MSNRSQFAQKGFLTFLSQGALCVSVACATLALPAHAAKPDAKAKPAAASAKKTSVAAKSNDNKAADKAAPKAERVARGKADKDQVKTTTRVAKAGKDDKAATTKVAARAAKDDKAEAPVKGKAATAERASTRKGVRQADDKPVLQVRYAAGGVSKGTAVKEPEVRAGKGAKTAATTERPARRLGKAERLKAEREARLEAEELARKQAIEAEREKRVAEAARLERQRELDRQREAERQKRLAAAAKAKRDNELEQDRIATLLAERNSRVREVGAPAPSVVAAPAAASVIAPAAVLAAASAAPALSLVPSQPIVARPVVAQAPVPAPIPSVTYTTTRVAAPAVVAAAPVPAPIVVAPAPAPVRTLVAAAPARVQPEQNHFVRVSVPQRDTLGRIGGLGNDSMMSPAGLHSSVAFVMDQQTGEVLLNKNGRMVSSIASITKLMTAVVIMDANLSMDERITITYDDVDRLKGSSSRLAVGTTLTRQELLHLTLMSSENRAAHALGRTYPGGMSEFVRTMNMRAMMLGMNDTRYVEPTGLNSANRSSARDLALLTKVAYSYPLIRNYTTYPGAEFAVNGRSTRFNNTNRLVHSVNWDIGLQKTGFISEAGRCVVMQSNINGRNVLIVLMDSSSSNKRVEDAEAIRNFVEAKSRGSRGFASTIASRGAVDMAY